MTKYLVEFDREVSQILNVCYYFFQVALVVTLPAKWVTPPVPFSWAYLGYPQGVKVSAEGADQRPALRPPDLTPLPPPPLQGLGVAHPRRQGSPGLLRCVTTGT